MKISPICARNLKLKKILTFYEIRKLFSTSNPTKIPIANAKINFFLLIFMICF